MDFNQLLTLASILGLVYGLWRTTPFKSETLFLPATYILFVLIYLAAILDIAPATAAVLRACGLAGFALHFLNRHQKPQESLVEFFSPGTCLFIAAAVGFAFFFKDAHLRYWDEFSHWGLRAKEFAFSGTLYGDSLLNASSRFYPPGTATWNYLVNGPTFSEGSCYFAQFLLLLAPAVVLFTGLRWDKAYISLLPLGALIFLITGTGHGIASLYVDHLLAMLLGGILATALAPQSKPANIWILFAPLAALPLIKEAGLLLAVMGAVFTAILLLVRKSRYDFKPVRWAIIGCLLVAMPLAASATWKQQQKRPELKPMGFNQIPAISVIADEASHGFDGYRKEVWNRLATVITDQQVIKDETSLKFNEFSWGMKDLFKDKHRLSTLTIFLLFLVSVAGLYAVSAKEDRPGILAAGLALSAMYIAYIGGLALVYLYSFHEQNALRIPSYIRYVHIMILPLFFCLTALCLPSFSLSGRENSKGLILLTVLLAFFYIAETPPLLRSLTPFPGHNLGTQVPTAMKHIGPKGRILIIKEGNQAGLDNMLRYAFAPAKIRLITPDKAVADSKEFIKTMEQSDALAVYSISRDFAQKYPDLTQLVQESPVLSITKEGKRIALRALPPEPATR